MTTRKGQQPELHTGFKRKSTIQRVANLYILAVLYFSFIQRDKFIQMNIVHPTNDSSGRPRDENYVIPSIPSLKLI